MSNFFKKIDKKVLCGIAGLIGLLMLVVGILQVCENDKYGVGALINSFVYVLVYGLLVFFLFKAEKGKTSIVLLLLLGSIFLGSLGGAISNFISAGEYSSQLQQDMQFFTDHEVGSMRTMIASVVFQGIAFFALFFGAASFVLLNLFKKVPADKAKMAGTIDFLSAALFAFVGFILMLVISGDFEGNQVAITIIQTLNIVLESCLFAALLNQDTYLK